MEERICESDEFYVWSERQMQWQVMRAKVVTVMRWLFDIVCRYCDTESTAGAQVARSCKSFQWIWQSASCIPATRCSNVCRGRRTVPACRHRYICLFIPHFFAQSVELRLEFCVYVI